MRTRKTETGQTLIMALILLGVLLVLGMVFIGIINRNISSSSKSQSRSVATDLAEAGVRYAHMQLLNSPQKADVRFALVSLSPAGDFTRDPDALYLRPGTGNGIRSDADPQTDLGGPDGLGPFTRVNFEKGRALVRIRYAPSDFDIFATSPIGPLLNPAQARNYTIIESIGRPGKVDLNDPTTLSAAGGIQYRNYPDTGTFRQTLGDMRNRDQVITQSRKVIAFASIGIIEDAMFITDKDQSGQPAELGFAPDIVQYEGQNVSVPQVLGTTVASYTPGNPPANTTTNTRLGGSIYINPDVIFHGQSEFRLNPTLGDRILVHGMVTPANNTTSSINFLRSIFDGTNWVDDNVLLTGTAMESRNPAFSTLGGLFRDGVKDTDANNDARSVGRKEPPSILKLDADTGMNPYVTMSRDSGQMLAAGNSGRYGHGRNPYINNIFDKQERSDADSRADVGTAESLVYDWFHPNNAQQGSGWKGPFYCPPGAYVVFNPDGFTISRDGTNRPAGSPDNQRTWRRADGSDSGLTTIRYRIGDVGGVPYIINTLTPGVNINVANPDFSRGLPFDGVIFFEGNARVRGVIPTDRQISLISMATIYIEGSITKGIVDASGNRIDHASRSTLMLMAKDYVAVNTTQFFGPGLGQNLQEVDESTNVTNWNPLRIAAGDGVMSLFAEFLVDPNGSVATPNNPTTYRSYLSEYREFDNPTTNSGTPLDVFLLLTHAMDDGAAPYSFISLDVNYGLPTSTYLFPLDTSNNATSFYPTGYITPGYTFAGYAPIYGLGANTWQRYAKMESNAFRLLATAGMTEAASSIVASGPEGLYTTFLQETSQLTLRTTSLAAGSTNDYLLARTAVIPHDIRIEAGIYAEEGSFVVIPGNWFNPSPNDTRENFASLGANDTERNQARLETYGSSPWTPFYNEPLDVRISIIGSVSENMPLPMSMQTEWLKKWGWIPRYLGSSGRMIPWTHAQGYNLLDSGTSRYVPNLTISHDPVLATGKSTGFDPAGVYVRTDNLGRALPPMPRLPVSPTLSYFGEVKP